MVNDVTVVRLTAGLPTGYLPVRLPIVSCVSALAQRPNYESATNMTDTVKVRFEPKMMIDGKLVDGQAGTFTNLNPATEEVLGEVADASKEDMHRAIDAARRAFDDTDWSTNRELRSAACCSCTTRSSPRRRSYARNSSSKSAPREPSPSARSWTRRWPTG